MWYKTEEEAKKACEEKKKLNPDSNFHVVKDSEQEDVYWATRYKDGT